MLGYYEDFNGFPVTQGKNMNKVSNASAADWKSWFQYFKENYYARKQDVMRCPSAENGGPRFRPNSGSDWGAWGRYGYNHNIGARGGKYSFDGTIAKIPKPSTTNLLTDSIFNKAAATPKGYSWFADYSRVDLRHGSDSYSPYYGGGVMAYVDGHVAMFTVDRDNPGTSKDHPLSKYRMRIVLPTEN